jgi:glyoxylase-like metal-dependent hydrolase (beta-lactamase superfamily II)
MLKLEPQRNTKHFAGVADAPKFRGMNLEDHLGDVIRKARKAGNVTPEAAAKAAGIGVSELGALENTGETSAAVDYQALAQVLGLDGSKVESLARGWKPSPKDLSQWRELRMIPTEQGGNTVNCYLVWDEVSREAALFDTGWRAEPVLEIVGKEQLQLKHLFLTHSHEDHIAAMAGIRERFPKILLHTDTKNAPPQHKNRRNDCIQLGSLRITNRETPGHAEDGVIYLVGNFDNDAPHVAIIGDTLFAGSMATGFVSWDVLKERVRSQIFSLPPETLLCPGHGPLTTVGEEKEHNPFF